MPVSLQSNALLALDEAKALIEWPVDDAESDEAIATAINAASDQIETFCRRTFREAVVTAEAHDGDGYSTRLLARNPPIHGTPTLAVAVIPGSTPQALTIGAHFAVDATGSFFELLPCSYSFVAVGWGGGWFPSGIGNVVAGYTGGFTAIPSRVRRACALTVMQKLFSLRQDPAAETTGIASATKRRVITASGLPPEAESELGSYRRLLAGGI